MAYTVVNGTVTYPANVSGQKIDLTADIVLSWPLSLTTDFVVAGFNQVYPDQSGHTITLPDATLADQWTDVLFSNPSIYTYDVLDNESNVILTVAAGQTVDLKLSDNSTAAGVWEIYPFTGGYSGLVAFQVTSSDSSINIDDGDVTPPGGIIDFTLPTSLSNLNKVDTVGFPVILDSDPLTWTTRELIAGENIAITYPDGIDGDPVINLSSSPTALSSISVGDFTITGSVLDCNATNGDLSFSTNGTGKLNFNGVLVDTDNNISQVKNLTVTGNFNNPLTPTAWATFTDIIVGLSNDITVQSQANISSITGSNGSYRLNFIIPQPDINYGILITLGTSGGSTPFVSHGFWTVRETDYVVISIVDASGELVESAPYGVTVVIMSV